MGWDTWDRARGPSLHTYGRADTMPPRAPCPAHLHFPILTSLSRFPLLRLICLTDGSYMCEYRPWLTGIFDVFITLDGCDIVGSPYELTVITLRPDAVKCDVRGEALRHAVARSACQEPAAMSHLRPPC